jgi:hypothetical protein
MKPSHLRATSRAAALLCAAALAAACAEPAEKLAPHFEALAAEAEAQKLSECQMKPPEGAKLPEGEVVVYDQTCLSARCPKMGAKLNDYLKRNSQAMGDLISQHGKSSPSNAQRLYIATERIDAAVQLCTNDKVIATFRHDLAKLINTHTGSPR